MAAGPYLAVVVGAQFWRADEFPSLLFEGILVLGLLSAATGLVGIGIGIAAYRATTRSSQRAIAAIAIILSAASVAAFAAVLVVAATWTGMSSPTIPP